MGKVEGWKVHLQKWQTKLDQANEMIARALPEITYAKKRIKQLQQRRAKEQVVEKVADLDIPPFLDRTLDPAERKREKSRVRIEKLKAKQRGDTERMPLSGREALAAIRESS